jgi:hypothetical protein
MPRAVRFQSYCGGEFSVSDAMGKVSGYAIASGMRYTPIDV